MKKSNFIDLLKSDISDWYSKKGIDHVWSPKENKHLGMMIATLKILGKQKTGNVPSAERLIEAIFLVLDHMPEWYLQNAPTIASINGNLLNIIQKIKHEQKPRSLKDQINQRLRAGHSI